MPLLHPDRLFPADPATRAIARSLYATIQYLPIISPHGHTQAAWFAENKPFANPTSLFLLPDHYIYRMLYSQGDVTLEQLGIGTGTAERPVENPRAIWRLFAERYFLFRGTPTRLWLDYVFQELFGLQDRLSAVNADQYYDTIAAKLATPELLPRSIYERAHLEVLATTDAATDPLTAHIALRSSGWNGRILPTFRPDCVRGPRIRGLFRKCNQTGAYFTAKIPRPGPDT